MNILIIGLTHVTEADRAGSLVLEPAISGGSVIKPPKGQCHGRRDNAIDWVKP